MKFFTSIFLAFFLFTSPGFAQNYGDATDEEIQQALQALQNSMMGTTSDVEVADVYEFTTSVDILITNTDSRGQQTDMKMRMLFPQEESYYAMELLEVGGNSGETPETVIIFDYLNLKMISLINTSGNKMGIAMDLSNEQIADWTEEDGEDDLPSFTKTGKTKEILGYSCEQYLVSNNTGKGEFWVTDDEDLKIGLALNAMSQSSNGSGYDMPKEFPDGSVLEMNYSNSDGGEMKWLATEIHKKINKKIYTEGYTFISMGK